MNESDYEGLAELLNGSGAPLPLSEIHGGLCGVICASGREAAVSWIDSLMDDCQGDADILARFSRDLEQLCDESWRALNGLSMDFYPLLPADDAGISRRADALGSWCHGFLAGLVIGGFDLSGGTTAVSAELTELVRDLAEISKAGADPDIADESELDEESYTELVEFIRVGAQFVFEELARDSRAERTLH
jgi:uncharacterized protein YgfB (UPF0149 family)